jgi:hypothetical protein
VGHQAGRLLVAGVDRPRSELDEGALGLDHRPAHDVEHVLQALSDE